VTCYATENTQFELLLLYLQTQTYNRLVRCVTFTQPPTAKLCYKNSHYKLTQRRLAGYKNCCYQVKVKVTLRLTVSQSVSLGVEPHLGLMTRYLLLSDSYGLVFVGRPLWHEDGSVFCICCWPLPAQSSSGPSTLGLATIFYCLRFETSLFVASYDSQGHGGGIRPRLHTGRHAREDTTTLTGLDRLNCCYHSNWGWYRLGADRTENSVFPYCCERCLRSRC
jgi:hypothetical protein